jgi:hypothetical protein
MVSLRLEAACTQGRFIVDAGLAVSLKYRRLKQTAADRRCPEPKLALFDQCALYPLPTPYVPSETVAGEEQAYGMPGRKPVMSRIDGIASGRTTPPRSPSCH